MKIYLHYEAKPDFTQVLPVDSPTFTVEEALCSFVQAYNRKHGHVHLLDMGSLTIWSEKKKQVHLCTPVTKAFADRDDMYVVSSKPQACVQPPAASTSLHAQPSPLPSTSSSLAAAERSAASLSLEPASASASAPAPELAVSGKDSTSTSHLPAILQSSLDKAQEAANARNLRLARTIYEQVLQLVPNHPSVLYKLARLWLDAGRAQEAVEQARLAVQHGPNNSQALQLLGEALSAAGHGEEAVRQLEAALAASSREGTARQNQVKLALAKALHKAYLAALEACESDDDSDQEQLPSTSGAPASFRSMLERCVQLVMSLVSEDSGNWDYLFMYATLAMERGMLEDAVRVCLRLLTVRSSDAEIKALLAQCLMLPQSLPLLLAELGSGASGSGAALAFLANCIKDHGAVAAAVQLFGRAVAAEPLNSSYSLNYIHALELDQEYDAVCAEVSSFCSRCGLQLAAPLQSLDVLVALLQSLPPLAHPTHPSWVTAGPYHPGLEHQPISSTGHEASSLSGHLQASADPLSSTVEYTAPQLDLLASLFTVVKVAYVGGALACTARICSLLNPARLASATELHTTVIRNEAAYFGCVLQLLRDCPPTDVATEAGKPAAAPLYICGDSHCLPPAWRKVQLRGEARLLHPLLVTGCKIWHLRPESRFYPKLQFLNTIRKLEPGTQVVMLFGEIDCREGLLLAVEKCKYESLEEGIHHTLEIYTDLLLELIKERNLELFVHPIMPVLKETRPIVLAFMKAMKRKVLKAAASAEARGRLHYLDFFDQLLDAAHPPGLKPHLEFDGTHANPAYVMYLAEALSTIK